MRPTLYRNPSTKTHVLLMSQGVLPQSHNTRPDLSCREENQRAPTCAQSPRSDEPNGARSLC